MSVIHPITLKDLIFNTKSLLNSILPQRNLASRINFKQPVNISEASQSAREATPVITTRYVVKNSLPQETKYDLIGKNFDKYA